MEISEETKKASDNILFRYADSQKTKQDAGPDRLIVYLTTGAIFAAIQFLDQKFRQVYQKNGYIVFLVNLLKVIAPLAYLVVRLEDFSDFTTPELLLIWFMGVGSVLIMATPVYFVFRLLKKIVKRRK